MEMLEFACEGNRFALPLHHVSRVIPAAAPTTLPGAPSPVAGMLNLRGKLVAVVSLASRLGLPERPLKSTHRIIVLDLEDVHIGLSVDHVHGLTHRELAEIDKVPSQLPSAAFIEGVVRLDDGLCIICDPEKFLLSDERLQLAAALQRSDGESH